MTKNNKKKTEKSNTNKNQKNDNDKHDGWELVQIKKNKNTRMIPAKGTFSGCSHFVVRVVFCFVIVVARLPESLAIAQMFLQFASNMVH